MHFIHCLVPRAGTDEADVTISQPGVLGEGDLALDVPTLRVQLCGAQLLDALRLYRIGTISCWVREPASVYRALMAEQLLACGGMLVHLFPPCFIR